MLDEQELNDKLSASQPIRFKGMDVEFQDEGRGIVTDETDDAICIASRFFTGWMFKAEYFDLLGVGD
jgi:hypothetical protein